MQTPSRPRIGGLVVGIVLGLSVALAVQPGVAVGAASLGEKVAKALKLAKRADKKATAALEASGQPGPQGPQGPPGPRGPSSAVSAGARDGLTWTNGQQVVASVPVVAGHSYVFVSHVVANNNADTTADVTCELVVSGAAVADASVELGAQFVDDREVISLTAAQTVAVAGTAQLACSSPSISGNWIDRRLTAIEVASLN